jgi:hypothetical protein
MSPLVLRPPTVPPCTRISSQRLDQFSSTLRSFNGCVGRAFMSSSRKAAIWALTPRLAASALASEHPLQGGVVREPMLKVAAFGGKRSAALKLASVFLLP